jgi:hypothetical protein
MYLVCSECSTGLEYKSRGSLNAHLLKCKQRIFEPVDSRGLADSVIGVLSWIKDKFDDKMDAKSILNVVQER